MPLSSMNVEVPEFENVLWSIRNIAVDVEPKVCTSASPLPPEPVNENPETLVPTVELELMMMPGLPLD